MTNFELILIIFGFLEILVPYAEIWPVIEVQRLGVALFPYAAKLGMTCIFGKPVESSQNPFLHSFQRGPKFLEKREKVAKNQRSGPLFDRRCASGATLGDWIFEGVPMGHLKKFKVLWKLDLKR